MNAGMKDMLNVASKFLALGLSVDDVILRSTWNPARAIRQEHLAANPLADPAPQGRHDHEDQTNSERDDDPR